LIASLAILTGGQQPSVTGGDVDACVAQVPTGGHGTKEQKKKKSEFRTGTTKSVPVRIQKAPPARIGNSAPVPFQSAAEHSPRRAPVASACRRLPLHPGPGDVRSEPPSLPHTRGEETNDGSSPPAAAAAVRRALPHAGSVPAARPPHPRPPVPPPAATDAHVPASAAAGDDVSASAAAGDDVSAPAAAAAAAARVAGLPLPPPPCKQLLQFRIFLLLLSGLVK
jgi:hypothetical protein